MLALAVAVSHRFSPFCDKLASLLNKLTEEKLKATGCGRVLFWPPASYLSDGAIRELRAAPRGLLCRSKSMLGSMDAY
jgi:hypothetical protein